jgi:hypothetical protein
MTLKHKGQHGADDDDQTDNIDDRVHDISPGLRVMGERHAAAAVPRDAGPTAILRTEPGEKSWWSRAESNR